MKQKRGEEKVNIAELIVSRLNHGSEDSRDQDVLFLLSKLPSYSECYNFAKRKKEEENIDANFFTVFSPPLDMRDLEERKEENCKGYVGECFKGLPDEVNNQIVDTYCKREQEHKNPVLEKVERIVPLKIVSSIYLMCVSLRRQPMYREEIVVSLRKNDFGKMRQTLSHVDFVQLKGKLSVEQLKFFAFQISQCLSLCEGKEFYTKKELSEYCQDLEGFLGRKDEWISSEEKLALLQKRKEELISDKLSSLKLIQHKGLVMMNLGSGTQLSNVFQKQCSGIVISLEKNRTRIVHYGMDLKVEGVFSVFFWGGDLMFCDHKGFDTSGKYKKQKVMFNKKINHKHWSFSFFHHTLRFKDEKIFLHDLRSKVTNKLMDDNFVQKYSELLGFCT